MKLKDLIRLDESVTSALAESLSKLMYLTEEYSRTKDLFTLEDLKRRFVAELQYYTEQYSRFKSFKGPNHTYFETQRKKLKAETLERLLANGIKITQADMRVYADPIYVEATNILDKATASFIAAELKYEQFNNTLQAMIQSIAVASKDYHISKTND